MKETLLRLARLAVREEDAEVVLANCIGTIEAGVGMLKEKTSAEATAVFLLSMAGSIVEHADNQLLAAQEG